MVKQMIQQSETIQKQEEIPAEVITKFDNDKQLVQEFLDQGYSVAELQSSDIIHPTKFDPAVMLGDKCLGFWIDKPSEQKWRDDSRTYQNRFRS